MAAVVTTEGTVPSFALDADMRLQPEVPLVALPGLVHLQIALPDRVPGRRRRMNDGRIDDRASRDPDPFAFPGGCSPHPASVTSKLLVAQLSLHGEAVKAMIRKTAGACRLKRRRYGCFDRVPGERAHALQAVGRAVSEEPCGTQPRSRFLQAELVFLQRYS